MAKDNQQLESVASEPAQTQPAGASTAQVVRRSHRFAGIIKKLRFFRAMLWVLVYATAGLFLISVIITGGMRVQSKIIGGALVVALLLIAATYGLQWYG